jgi:type I restriction-modification system DNA methylase subunit
VSRQIKSKERVSKFAEVFTAKREVEAMCNLIPSEIWENIGSTFLEPACGNGNFLVEILERKLNRCENVEQGLTALKSVYGIDIQQDNVEESKLRLFDIFIRHFPKAPAITGLEAAAILDNNIICGDSLKITKKMEDENG